MPIYESLRRALVFAAFFAAALRAFAGRRLAAAFAWRDSAVVDAAAFGSSANASFAARDRAGVVIGLMRENGDISSAEAASADPAEIRLVPPPKQNSIRYFTDWALPQLDTLIDETQAPLDVWTTLDPAMQRSAGRSSPIEKSVSSLPLAPITKSVCRTAPCPDTLFSILHPYGGSVKTSCARASPSRRS